MAGVEADAVESAAGQPPVDQQSLGQQGTGQQGTGRQGTGQQSSGKQGGDRPTAGSDRLPAWLITVVPALAELAVGGYRIGGPSLWRDEAATISGSQRPLGAIMSLALHQDAVHDAYYLLMHAVIAIGGISASALRLPSLIAMCLAAGLTAALGRRLAASSGLPAPALTGLLAGLLLVVVPLNTRYAQEARPYALTTLFAVLATYLLVRGVASDRWPLWACYAAALTVTGLMNLFAVLLVVAHGLSLLVARSSVTRSSVRRWLAACATSVVLLAPLAVLSIRQSSLLNWVTRPDPSTVASLVRDFSGTTALIPLVALLGILGCVAGPGVKRGAGLTLAIVALPWLIAPPVILLVISFVHPVYVERYVVFCLPALSLLVAAGLVGLTTVTRQAVTQHGTEAQKARALAVVPSVLLAVAVVAASIGPQRAIRLPTARADNLRAVAAVLSAHERPGDAILYLPWDTAIIGTAYPAFGHLDNVGLGESPDASATLRGLPAASRAVITRLRGIQRVWTVQWAQPLPSAGPVRTGLVTASGLRLIRRWRISSILLALYVRA